jgi:3-keto-disaccharide hydrolase
MRLTIVLSVFWVAMITPASTALADVETVEASISAVDAKGRSITFATKDPARPKLELEVSRKAAVTLDGKPATLEILRAGQTVRVTYDPALEVATAVEVFVATRPDAGVELFNGTDLEGWQHRMPLDPRARLDECWEIDSDRKVLICLGHDVWNWIETEKDYGDYVLTLEWRLVPGGKVTPPGSGVVVKVAGAHSSGRTPRGIEVNLGKGNSGNLFTLGTPLQTATAKATGEKPVLFERLKDAEKPAGQWNRYEIGVKGDRITARLNGVLVNQAHGAKSRPGRVGLLSQGTAVEFRNIRLVAEK